MEKKEEVKKVEEPKTTETKKDKVEVVDNSKELQELREQVKRLEEAQKNAVVETVPGYVDGIQASTNEYSFDDLREKARLEAVEDRIMVVQGSYFNEPGTDFANNPYEWTEQVFVNLYKRDKEKMDKLDGEFWQALENCDYRKMLHLAVEDRKNMDAVTKALTDGKTPFRYSDQHSKINSMYDNVFRKDSFNPNSDYNLFRAIKEQRKMARIYNQR